MNLQEIHVFFAIMKNRLALLLVSLIQNHAVNRSLSEQVTLVAPQ